jgi:hypothetical protein
LSLFLTPIPFFGIISASEGEKVFRRALYYLNYILKFVFLRKKTAKRDKNALWEAKENSIQILG